MPRPNKKLNQRPKDSNSEDKSNTNITLASKKTAQIKSGGVSNNEKADLTSENDCVELSPSERYEKKFSQALEKASEKSSKTRALALQSLCEILMHRYMPDYVEERKIKLLDCIERSIVRGKGTNEQMWALRLAPLLIIQLGGHEGISFRSLNQFLLTNVQDKSVSFDSRAKYCTALGLLNFLGDAEINDLLTLMQCFEGIFSASYLKGAEKISHSVSAEAGTLHAKALSAWGLLLTLIPPKDFGSWMTRDGGHSIMPSFKELMGLLQSPYLPIRIAAGKTLALILDCGRAHDSEFLSEYLNDLIETFKELATDSRKYRAKRDRKSQRALFRDLLHYLEEDKCRKIKIRLLPNDFDSLILDSWAIHHKYSALRVVIGPSMTLQLKGNQFVRDIFNVDPKPDPATIQPSFFSFRTISRKKIAYALKARTRSRAESRRTKKIRYDVYT